MENKMEMPSSEHEEVKKSVDNHTEEFDKSASELGWELVSEHGFFDGKDRFTPSGRLIYDGYTVYKNSRGQFADSYFIADLIRDQKDKKQPKE
ncbi:MAG: hypothetical protein NUW02_03255 [Candidatus Campbellbacteria bacterium]|nr:hypothetical protein [Candidatus Campbellbacteria bacterium]